MKPDLTAKSHKLEDPEKAFHRCTTYRGSCPEVLCKKGVLRNFAKFTGKHLCQSLLQPY